MGETRVFIPYLLQICACTRISFGLHLAQDALPLLTKKKKKDRLNLFMLERKKKKMGGTGLETEWKYSSTTIHTYMAGNDYTCLTSLEPRQVGDSLRSPLSFLFFLLNSTTQVFLHTNPPVACVYVRFTTLGPFSMAILRSFNGLLRTSSDIRKKTKTNNNYY